MSFFITFLNILATNTKLTKPLQKIIFTIEKQQQIKTYHKKAVNNIKTKSKTKTKNIKRKRNM